MYISEDYNPARSNNSFSLLMMANETLRRTPALHPRVEYGVRVRLENGNGYAGQYSDVRVINRDGKIL